MNAASKSPLASRSAGCGKGASIHWIVSHFTPLVFSVDMTSRSEMVLRAVTATRLPSMSLMDLTFELGMATTTQLFGPADDASEMSLTSTAPLALATKNGV